VFFDTNYIFYVMIPALILSLGAQFFVKRAYSKWSQVRNSSNMTGVQVAEQIMSRTNVRGVQLESVAGQLSDHYDPRSHTVRMSQDIASVPSVASMAIVAHELGHAQQHQEHSPFIAMRNFLLPAVQFSPQVSYLLIFLGLFLRITEMLYLGIAAFGLVVVFMILTLPVEFDASFRGLRLLREAGLMQAADDQSGARQVLTAAALTYVAAAVGAVLQLLYYLSLANRRR
jgi:Zn-dependent membrane protease YugP